MAGGSRSSLVVWVGVRAGAGLAVLRGTDGRVAEEAGGALLAQLTLGVVQAALIGQINPFICHILSSARPVDSLWAFVPCRCPFPGGRSPSGRYTRTARSVPGTTLLLCACIQVHNP